VSQQRLRFEKIVNVAKSMDSLVNQLLFLARHEGRLAAESLKEIDPQPTGVSRQLRKRRRSKTSEFYTRRSSQGGS